MQVCEMASLDLSIFNTVVDISTSDDMMVEQGSGYCNSSMEYISSLILMTSSFQLIFVQLEIIGHYRWKKSCFFFDFLNYSQKYLVYGPDIQNLRYFTSYLYTILITIKIIDRLKITPDFYFSFVSQLLNISIPIKNLIL